MLFAKPLTELEYITLEQIYITIPSPLTNGFG